MYEKPALLKAPVRMRRDLYGYHYFCCESVHSASYDALCRGHLQRDRVASPCSRQLGELLLGRWLGVVLCMDGDKTVKRNFEREGVMVLNALSRDMLDDAEALGGASGREKGQGYRPLCLGACQTRACSSTMREPLALRNQLAEEPFLRGWQSLLMRYRWRLDGRCRYAERRRLV